MGLSYELHTRYFAEHPKYKTVINKNTKYTHYKLVLLEVYTMLNMRKSRWQKNKNNTKNINDVSL